MSRPSTPQNPMARVRTLLAISFTYGFFRRRSSHGKAVISSYLVASETAGAASRCRSPRR
jgi:ABC-type nickel/cobalt efflux system permease component RcnA